MPEKGWPFEDHVIQELRDLRAGQLDTNKALGDLRTEIALLKYKSGLFGALAGAVPGVLAAIINNDKIFTFIANHIH